MENTKFTYEYSAKNKNEIEEIRKRYLPKEETKLDELKKLDDEVNRAGMIESLCMGIFGSLVFGLGFCFVLQVLGEGLLFIVLGVVLGIIGAGIMLFTYPLYSKIHNEAKEKLSSKILELTSELLGEKTE